ncbi:MAG: YihY family inner membrane protein [Nitrospirota bacterium]|nr:YihY family inner membrane protein [Nitrospirota bacterium]
MSSIFSKFDNFFKKDLWETRRDSSGKLKNVLITVLQLLHKIGQEFLNGEIPRRASSLVYTSLLTIVPILAVAFSVVKAFGVHNMLEPFMRNFLAPLGEKGDEITFNIITYVERINVGLLGMIGLAALTYTVMNTIQQVENSFNYLWQISEKRNLLKRFRDYMSVLLAGPVLIVAALGITTSIMSNTIAQKIISIEPFGTVLFLIGKLLPYMLISVAFTLIYYLLPYTKVNFRSAFVGGISAGILWQAGSWTFARFIVSSTQYSAIYSGFAIVLLFMIWLYYNWVIILIGVKVSFYHQFPILLHMRDERIIYSEWYMQRLAIMLMYLVGYNFFHDKHRWTLPALMERLRTPKGVVQDILEALEKSGLILRVDSDETFVPGRDIETITLSEIVNSVRGEFQDAYSPLNDFTSIPGIEKIMSEVQNTINNTFSKETLKKLVTSHIPDNKKTI